MKTIKNFFFIVATIFLLATFACQNGADGNSTEADSLKNETIDSVQIDTDNTEINQSETVAEDADYMAKYVCPMHCEGSGSDKKGMCPKCGMDLIENPDYKKN